MTAVAEQPTDTHDDHHDHPTDAIFWKVGGVLAVLTAVEVSTYFWPSDWRHVADALLLVLMAIKFVTVAMYFMHLKYDKVILRRVFFSGLILASLVYIAALSAMLFWHHSGTTHYNNPPLVRVQPPPPTTTPAD